MTKKWRIIMSKINITIKVNNYIINTNAIKKDNIITCIDNNDKKTKITIDTQKPILTRETKDLIITLNFKNKTINYYLKEQNKTLTQPLNKVNITKKLNKITIKYIIEQELFTLEITENKI